MDYPEFIKEIKGLLPKYLNIPGATDDEIMKLFTLSREKNELIDMARDKSEIIQEILANIQRS